MRSSASCSSVFAAISPAVEPRGATCAEDATVARFRETVIGLLHAITHIANDETEAALDCLQQIAGILQVNLCRSEPNAGARKISRPIPRGSLAPWQARLVKAHIESHLDRNLRTEDLAKLVGLSPFHFSRVFGVSFGRSPHQYVTRRRLERAQGLMLTTDLPLGQIAIDCGFADQAHFTKLFRRFADESPGEWRRTRAQAPHRTNRLEANSNSPRKGARALGRDGLHEVPVLRDCGELGKAVEQIIDVEIDAPAGLVLHGEV